MKSLLNMSCLLFHCVASLTFVNCNLIIAAPPPPMSKQGQPMYPSTKTSNRTKQSFGLNKLYKTSTLVPVSTPFAYKLDTYDSDLEKRNIKRSSNFKPELNSFSTTSENPGTTTGQKTNGISPFVVVAIVLSGIVGLYLIYLLLLLSVVAWTHIFQRFNMYNYVEVLE